MTTLTPVARQNDFFDDDASYRAFVQRSPEAVYVIQDGQLAIVNAAGLKQLRGHRSEDLVGKAWHAMLTSEHQESSIRMTAMLESGMAVPLAEQQYRCVDGTIIDVEAQLVAMSYKGSTAIQIVARDITARKRASAALEQDQQRFQRLADEANRAKELLQVENRILEMMAFDCDITTILNEVCRWVEEVISRGVRTSIMLVETDGIRLRTGAAPSLPDDFNAFMQGMPVGPCAGSCGTAMYLGRHVVARDIATDPLWDDCRQPALQNGLRACWSTPVLSASGISTGALNVYFDAPGGPEAADIAFVSSVTHLVGVLLRKDLVERSLQESEDRYRSVVASLTEGIVVQSRTGVILACNPSAERILGVDPETLTGARRDSYCTRLLNEDGAPIAHDDWPVRIAFRTGQPQLDLTVGLETPDGNVIWLRQNILPIHREQSQQFDTVLISFTDVTEMKAAQQRLQFMAVHDALTGLHNRVALTERVSHAITLAQRMKHQVAVIFLDLDRFKHVNDTAGHECGDSVLRTVADRLRECVRKTDTLARLGGDEFVIMAEGFQDPSYLNILCERVITAISEPFNINEHEHYLGVSIGIGIYPQDGTDCAALLRCADSAMYHAKESGRNNFKFYTAQLNEHTQRRYALERHLRQALAKNEFRVHYQPKIQSNTGNIVGAEALLRWQGSVLGAVSPVEFIPVAEEIGLIVDLGAWVLEEACRQAAVWRKQHAPSLRIAVNLSARQFHEPNLVPTIKAILERTGLDGEALEIEITESLLMGGIEGLMPTFNALIECGISFSLDDFGTGYSSLSYLQKFPISNIKIDRSFINGIPRNRDSVALTQAIVAMAQSLNMTVTAEGVEDNAQQAFLKQADCQEMQGFLFGKPVSGPEFAALLSQRYPAAL